MDNRERLGGVMDEARALIKTEGVSCVVIRGDEIIHTADGRGVAPLLDLYNNDREKLKGGVVVDRIIGKAAAMILALGQAESAYGEVMSEPARDYLISREIPYQFGQCVEVIAGRDGTGMCPIEASVLAIDDPEAGLTAMTKRIAELRQGAG